MSVATCAGCGKETHVYLEVSCDRALTYLVGDKRYCESCGQVVGKVIADVTWMLRFKKNANT